MSMDSRRLKVVDKLGTKPCWCLWGCLSIYILHVSYLGLSSTKHILYSLYFISSISLYTSVRSYKYRVKMCTIIQSNLAFYSHSVKVMCLQAAWATLFLGVYVWPASWAYPIIDTKLREIAASILPVDGKEWPVCRSWLHWWEPPNFQPKYCLWFPGHYWMWSLWT